MKRLTLFILLMFPSLMSPIPSLSSAQPIYVGSEKCISCHKAIYGIWKDTLHNKSQQVLTPTNDTVVVDWKGLVKIKTGTFPDATV